MLFSRNPCSPFRDVVTAIPVIVETWDKDSLQYRALLLSTELWIVHNMGVVAESMKGT